MIRFDFVVDEIDAENILQCIHDAAMKQDEYIMEYMNQPHSENYVEWHKNHKNYLLDLIGKMKNTGVEE